VTTDQGEQAVTFGRFRFDAGSGRLWSGTREIRLTPKASSVLAQLVKRAGEPVSKEDLFTTVWSGTAVSDDALTSCIQELRRALEDDSKRPRFIETRHRRGYRFVAAISMPPQQSVDEAGRSDEGGVQESLTVPASSAIAVLPFADMSPGRDQDYLCEGFAEELINALTHVAGLRVVARTASFQFRSPGADIRAIGRQLKVDTLLEGSVRKAADRLRVTVQLVEVESGYHRWSQRFDRRLDDVFAIQDEIAEYVATSLRGAHLSPSERHALLRPQTGTEAYEFYLRGRQHLPRMTQPDLEQSGRMFERAIALDPGYVPAWAGLANVHATLYEWFGARDDDLKRAEQASQEALGLGPEQAEAHVARGFVLSLSSSYDGAFREFEEAIRLNPNLFEAHYYFARTSFAHGDIERSADLFRRAAAARQEDFQSAALLAQSLRILGRPDDAAAATREAIRRAEHILTLNPIDGRTLSLGSGTLFHDGQIARAREWASRAMELYPEDMGTLLSAACLHLKLLEKEEALALLQRVFGRGWGKRDWVDHDPDYDILRDDPRFQTLVAHLK
jgi:TolB-like protein/Tfp pilus assembly protein PilF